MSAKVKGGKNGLDGSSLEGKNEDAGKRPAEAKARAKAVFEARHKAKADAEEETPPARVMIEDGEHAMMNEQVVYTSSWELFV